MPPRKSSKLFAHWPVSLTTSKLSKPRVSARAGPWLNSNPAATVAMANCNDVWVSPPAQPNKDRHPGGALIVDSTFLMFVFIMFSLLLLSFEDFVLFAHNGVRKIEKGSPGEFAPD